METIKLRAGDKLWLCDIWYDDYKGQPHMFFQPKGRFPKLREEIKKLEFRVWHGGSPPNWNNQSMYYSAPLTQRNIFTISYLRGPNPYIPYRKPLEYLEMEPRYNRQHKKVLSPFDHQRLMVAHIHTRRFGICAAEMRTGKTLCMITLAEYAYANGIPQEDIWYVGRKSAIGGVLLDFEVWEAKVLPVVMTWSEMTKRVLNWDPSILAPQMIFFDESSMYKNMDTQRTQAALHLSNSVRQDHPNGSVSLWTGTPAPKSPLDWWSQAEIACPGYLAEGNLYQFQARLTIQEQRENQFGGKYPHIITFKDNENKCDECGKLKDDPDHQSDDAFVASLIGDHQFIPSVNEVSLLARRLQGKDNKSGLSVNLFKSECINLPPKVEDIIRIKPSLQIKKYSKLINATAKSAAIALILQRELHDGFLYTEVEDGTKKCDRCQGTGTIISYGEEHYLEEEPLTAQAVIQEQESDFINHPDFQGNEDPTAHSAETKICTKCGGTKIVPKMVRNVERGIECPKEDILKELIDQYDECGRFVTFAGFQGSVDRVVSIFQAQDWSVVRMDGRGMECYGCDYPQLQDALRAFAKMGDYPEKLAWVAHPGAGGMGISLSASPIATFWSNDFSGEARLQAIERIHDTGMDRDLGARIVDIFHGPYDELVYNNLHKKGALQKMSMQQLKEVENAI